MDQKLKLYQFKSVLGVLLDTYISLEFASQQRSGR